MRSPSRSASSGSWVTSSTVRPARRPAASSCKRIRVIASSAENGSSMSTMGRSSIRVRASATRWRMPPESVRGRASASPPRPTRSSIARARARSGFSPRRRAPRETLPSALSQGMSRSCCAMYATDAPPRTFMLPDSSRSRPAMTRSRLDLPTPLGPSRQVQRPRSRASSRPSKSSAPSKPKRAPSTRTAWSDSDCGCSGGVTSRFLRRS